MSVPSVSVGAHDRYTPEIRDRILERLGAPIDHAAYHLLTPAQLRALARTESPDAPVLSFYLQLSPERRAGGAWHVVFSSLADAALKAIGNRRKRQAVKDEIDRIEAALQDGLPALGRGVAFFACRPAGLWQQIAVSVPLPDGVHFGALPYVRPLVRTRDEHDRFVLALLSREHSRFFISQIGQVEEVFQIKGPRPRRELADQATRAHGGVALPEPIKNEARVLAQAAWLMMAQFEGRYLLLSGPPELRSAFSQNLPKEARQRLGGEFAVEVHAGPAEIAAAAEPAQSVIEEREEVATVQRLLDAGREAAAWGERPTLDALWGRRVMTLVVDDIFAKPGARCRLCGGLWSTVPRECPTCGSDALDAVGDVVELALEQALEQKAALELLRSAAARRLMTARAPMAALLR